MVTMFNGGHPDALIQHALNNKCTSIKFESGHISSSETLEGLDINDIRRLWTRHLSEIGRQRLTDGARTYNVLVQVKKIDQVVGQGIWAILISGQPSKSPSAQLYSALKGADG